MAFVADDLGAWLVAVLADAGRRRLAEFFLGTEQECALRSAASRAVQLTADDLYPDGGEAHEHLTRVISEVFGPAERALALGAQQTLLEALRAGIAGQLAVLDDPSLTGTGKSAAGILGVAPGVLAEKLTGHLEQEIRTRSVGGGPLVLQG